MGVGINDGDQLRSVLLVDVVDAGLQCHHGLIHQWCDQILLRQNVQVDEVLGSGGVGGR